MAFPTDLEIEIAFNNDIDETDYAQSGWTSILPFVSGFSGTLRGRGYELERAEAGTVGVTLDNSDGRFLPGSVQSPYYPYVKSDRRFRIRGKNMLHPNVARGGSRDRDSTGFIDPDVFGNGVLFTLDTSYYSGVYAMDSVRIITANAEPNAGIGEGKEKVNDGLATTKWTINTQAGWLQYKLAVGVRVTRYTLTVPDGNQTRNPDDWTLQGSNNGSSWTTIHTVTGNTWTSDYEAQEFTVTSPGFYTYYKLDITGNVGAVANTQLAEWRIDYDDAATDLLLVDNDLTHFVEVTKPASQTELNLYHRTISWFIPVEYGVRMSHSAHVWRISGTEPTGTKIKIHAEYYDSDWVLVPAEFETPYAELTSLPTSTTPTQIGFSHTPPSQAKYGVVSFSIYIPATTNTTDLVYGVTGIQSELPANLAPDISGFRDLFNWQMQGNSTALGTFDSNGTDPLDAYIAVTWEPDDVNIFTTIPHLIPGEWYTATVEAQRLTGQPDVLFSGDEGETGALINSTSFVQYTTTFEAQQAEQELRFILQGTPTAADGLNIRMLRVERGENLSLSLPTTALESGHTTWTRPKDIFEGWIESWPAIAGSLEMTITAVDRMKRMGEVELANTLKESLVQDGPALLLPMIDSMLESPGRFSQLGYWADVEGGPTYVDIAKTRGDIGTATYTTQTDDGPTGEASFKNNPQSSTIGYMFAIPYSKDYTAPTTPTAPPSQPKPPPSKPKPTEQPKYVYVKKWYATWSRSYEGGNGTRFDDPDTMYQGQTSGSPGNQKSLAGFDYKNIMATLDGAEIIECFITVTNTHARWNKGLYVFVGTHGYASKPGTWNTSSVSERLWKKWVTEGGTVTVDAGATYGRGFREGIQKGIAIGPEADSDNYGIFRGAKQSGKPYITIKYRK